ncbi:MAG: acylphosphatase [Bacteroidales bacterium]
MKEHWNITIKGRVKEIDFLYYSELGALKAGLNGFIRNGNPGEVYMEVEGEAENIQKLRDYFNRQPLVDFVEDINASEGLVKDFSTFQIVKSKKKSKKPPGFMTKAKNFVLHLFS